jgi:hypothetical protein
MDEKGYLLRKGIKMKLILSNCNWPELSLKYGLALREAIEFILSQYPVSGIIASGTIIRGNPDQHSDLDIYVIHQEDFRQRVQKFFNGTPAEIFVNPPHAIEGYFEEEQASRRPLTAHMLATGFVILNLHPVVDELIQQAKILLSNPPAAPKDLTFQRYLIACLLEDAVDIFERDPEASKMIAYRAVGDMLNFRFIQAGLFIPRQKSLLEEIGKLDMEIAHLARRFFQEPNPSKKIELAGEIADQTIGARGFFEWDKPPEIIKK